MHISTPPTTYGFKDPHDPFQVQWRYEAHKGIHPLRNNLYTGNFYHSGHRNLDGIEGFDDLAL